MIFKLIFDKILSTDACTEAGTTCNGGQTVKNPWIIIGGVASSVCQSSEFIKYASYLLVYDVLKCIFITVMGFVFCISFFYITVCT